MVEIQNMAATAVRGGDVCPNPRVAGLVAGEKSVPDEVQVIAAVEGLLEKERTAEFTQIKRELGVELVETDEMLFLSNLKDELARTLRPVDDGVFPPRLARLKERRLRKEACDVTHRGTQGVRNPELVELRIHVLLLMMYQFRVSRNEAAELVLQKGPGLTSLIRLRNAIVRYASDEEYAYMPYSDGKGLTYSVHVACLRAKHVAFAGPKLPDDTVLDTRKKYRFRCLKVRKHPIWAAVLTSVRTRRGCPACGNTRKGRRKG